MTTLTASALDQLTDRQEILDRISDLAHGLDLPDPARYRRCFADTVEVRNPTFAVEGRSRRYTGDDWAESVGRTQAALTTRLHTLTSAAIELTGDTADVIVLQQALFADSLATYRVAGPLRLGFVRAAGSWRICRLHFEVTWSDGDPAVYVRARESAR